MNREDARETVAAYLSGQRLVDSKALAEALGSLAGEQRYREAFIAEVGLSAEYQSDCRVFYSRAAEICECPSGQVVERFPALMQHLENCEKCKRVYWGIKPLWIESVTLAAGRKAEQLVHRFAVSIRLLADASGLAQIPGLAPMGLSVGQVAATANRPIKKERAENQAAVGPGGGLEWPVSDAEWGLDLVLAVTAPRESQHGYLLECRPSGEDAAKMAMGLRVTLRSAESNNLLFSGPLKLFQECPVALDPGAYLVQIDSSEAASKSWVIPVEIEAGNKQ
jgi:hypothetical protein